MHRIRAELSFGTKTGEDARRRAGRLAVATILSVWSTVLLAPAAGAVDGVLEINQTCAVQTGCFGADTAGYPVTIASAGSYRLTSNLVVPNENTDGIVVSTSSVSIDLNGFEIVRSGCEGATSNCAPASGTGSGVETTSPVYRGLSVKNGSITGMGAAGLGLGDQAVVAGLRVRWNRVFGILAGTGSSVSNNTAYANGIGIFVDAGSSVSGNTAYGNGNNGIVAVAGSTVSENTADANIGDGISTGNGVTVQRNTVRLNGGYGLNLAPTAAYRENVITDNATGTVSSGVNLGDNSCNGATTCP